MPENLAGSRIGRYQVQVQVQTTSTMTVYRAQDAAETQTVLLHLLPAALSQNPRFAAHFEQVMPRLLRLNHPHMVRLLASGEHDGQLYYVTEDVEGVTLQDMLAGGPLDLAQAVTITHQVAAALAVAHSIGIVHRHVMPAHVIVPQDGPARLTAFATGSLFVVRAGAVTLDMAAYLAPEYASKANSPGPSADVYALGVMLFHMLAGRLPFTAPTTQDLLEQHMREPVPLVRKDAPDVPEVIERVVLRAMAKPPEVRFQHADEIEELLHAYTEGKQIYLDSLEPEALGWATKHERTQGTAAPPAAPFSGAHDAALASLTDEQRRMFDSALSAYDVGNMELARKMLWVILGEDDRVAEAWLLLSYVEENWYDQMQCAENALTVSPDMEDAQERVQTLRQVRIPATVGRTHSEIPAVREAHVRTMDEYFRESKLEASVDALDIPEQCPYCATLNGAMRRKCSKCGRSMMRMQEPQKAPTATLYSSTVLNLAAIVMAVLQIFPPVLWKWFIAQDSSTGVAGAMTSIFTQPIAVMVAGDFTNVMTDTIFGMMLIVGGVRFVLLLVAGLGIWFRLAWGYTLGITMFVVEVIWAVLLMGLGWTGLFIGAMTIIISMMGIGALAAASVNFRVTAVRYHVVPEGRLKSGAAYYKRGREYQRAGLWAMAVAQYRAAVGAAPNCPEHYKALGIGYNKIERNDRALPVLEQALRLDPTDLEVAGLLKQVREAHEKAEATKGLASAPQQGNQDTH